MTTKCGAKQSGAGRTVARTAVAGVLLSAALCAGCAVVAVTDAAVAVGATVVKAGAAVVGGAVDIARAGVRAVTDSSEKK